MMGFLLFVWIVVQRAGDPLEEKVEIGGSDRDHRRMQGRITLFPVRHNKSFSDSYSCKAGSHISLVTGGPPWGKGGTINMFVKGVKRKWELCRKYHFEHKAL